MSSITASMDGSGVGFKGDENCHVTRGLKLKEYSHYGILTGSDGFVKDVLFLDRNTPNQKVSICGKDSSETENDLKEGRFDQFEQAIDGIFAMFLYDMSLTKIELLGIISNRCLMTPEFAQV